MVLWRRPSRISLGPHFNRLWTAASISYLGDGVSAAALPLLATSLTGNAALIGLSGSIGSVPWLFFGLISGTLVDRWDRLRVMWTVDGARFCIVAALAAAVATGYGSIGLLLGVGLLLGIGQTLFDTASQATVPRLIAAGDHRLEGPTAGCRSARRSASSPPGHRPAGSCSPSRPVHHRPPMPCRSG